MRQIFLILIQNVTTRRSWMLRRLPRVLIVMAEIIFGDYTRHYRVSLIAL